MFTSHILLACAVFQRHYGSCRLLHRSLTRAEQKPGPARPLGTCLLPAAAEHGFLLSFGRAEPYKGFDDLLDALHILSASGLRVPHTVLAAVTDGPPPTAYQRHLAHRIDAGHLDVTLHTTFSPVSATCSAIPRWPALSSHPAPSRSAAYPSRHTPPEQHRS